MNDGVNFSQQSQDHAPELNAAASFCAPESNREEIEYYLDDILASANLASLDEAHTPVMSLEQAAEALRSDPRADRRKRRRARISAPVRVRGINVTDAVIDEVTTTIDVSRAGILFISSSPNYARGMEVALIFPYSTAPAALHAEQQGRVVRAFETPEGRYAVAIALGEGVGEDIVDACGRKLCDSNGSPRLDAPDVACAGGSSHAPLLTRSLTSNFTLNFARAPESKRPLVLVVDSDEMTRATLKAYLGGEGYDVMAASNCEDAREVLNMFTPALLIAEVEGEGLPGYDLCAHVKQTPRLKQIPVVLMTSSGYPSDYSNAHSLGAIVCMTKPYKQERLGHVARLLAPPPAEFCAKSGAGALRPADPSRRCGYNSSANGTNGNANGSGANGNGAANGTNSNGANSASRVAANPFRRFKFPSFR